MLSVCKIRPRFKPKVQVLTFCRRLVGSLSIAYVIGANSQGSRFLANSQQATHSLGPALLPGAFLVDWILSRTHSLGCTHLALMLTFNPGAIM